MAAITIYYDAPEVLCTLDTTTSVPIDDAPASIAYDFMEAVECLFCCCCSGSGSGSGAPACCPYDWYTSNPTTLSFDVWNGYSYDPGFVLCLSAGSGVVTSLTLTNQEASALEITAASYVLAFSDPCAPSAETFTVNILNATLPPGVPVNAVQITALNLELCCTYFPYVEIQAAPPMAKPFMAGPAKNDLVDSGIEADTGSSGIAGPGCTCFCEHPPAVTSMTKTVRPALPTAEEGFILSHEFLDLGGEPNCKYRWNLHVDWHGQGEGQIFARDRCSVIHIDQRMRDVHTGDSLPSASFDYQLLTCGPATIGLQMRNSVMDGIPHPGQVTVSAELAECLWGYNHACCCGPYPPCPELAAEPVVKCMVQADRLPQGWIVDKDSGFMLAGVSEEPGLAGLSYTVEGDPSCAYKVRLELDVSVSPTCLAAFAGGDYAGLAVGEDGKGSLYADLWVCGGASFTLLLSGSVGQATFKLTYTGERRTQTPVCCV